MDVLGKRIENPTLNYQFEGTKLILVYYRGTYGHTIEVLAYGMRGRARDIQTVAERESEQGEHRASSSEYWTVTLIESIVKNIIESIVENSDAYLCRNLCRTSTV